jgi:hypothetical protein
VTSDSSTLALVESPTQLLNVIELAHASSGTGDLVDLRVAVLAPSLGRSREQLRAVVALARSEGLGVSWHEPRSGGASVARTIRGLLDELGRARRLVVGDPFSGVLQVLVGLVRPTELTIVDDGTATLELVRQRAAAEPLHPWFATEAGTRLRVFTCMPLSEAGLEASGVEVRQNTYAWLKGRWCDPEVLDGVDLVGSSLVESGIVDELAYLTGVGRLVAQQGVTRYLAHRREPDDKLAQVRALGVDVVLPRLPLEIEARRGPVSRTLISFPSTGVHTLPVVLAGTGVVTLFCALPDSWYAPGVGAAADAFLRQVTASALSNHQLAAVAC